MMEFPLSPTASSAAPAWAASTGGKQAANNLEAAASTAASSTAPQESNSPLREAFDDFVGETFFTQMMQAMRSTVGEPAYFHGGRGEEVFQGQLDQIMSQQLSDASASTFTEPMFELFNMNRR